MNMDIEQYISDEAVAEFDRIVGEYERPLRRRRTVRWAAGLAAAAVIASVITIYHGSDADAQISPVEIAEGIDQLMNMKSEEITSITAVPQGSKAILTAHMKDGRKCSYIMTIEEGTGNLSLVAVNTKY